MRRREGDGCPVAGVLQLIGDKWTMLVVRDLAAGPKRTTQLLTGLYPISSRTLVARLRDMERDQLLERIDFGGNPPHVEYQLTNRGRLLLPFLETLRRLGQLLECNDCEDRRKRLGSYCAACPLNDEPVRPLARPNSTSQRERDDSIVLL